MSVLTIFTPTYNRAHTLPRLFESLCGQTDPDFTWLIVDDGSGDGTDELVASWRHSSSLNILYVYQTNAGMLSAHNTAYDSIDSELAVCVDSDDYLSADAVKTIKRVWESRDKTVNSVGMVGLDAQGSGGVLGDAFPPGLRYVTFKDLRFKYRLRGDKKYIYSMSAVNKAGRFPVIPSEKYPAASYLYRLMDRLGPLIVINRVLCVVEYQEDGNSKQKIIHYKRSPNAFMHFRMFCICDAFNFREAALSAIHYISAAIFAKRYFSAFNNRYWYLTIPAIPAGVVLNFYLRFTSRKGFI